MKNSYDPLIAPDPAAWLALDEGERIELVRAYHGRQGIEIPKEQVHAVVHVVIENQLAERFPPAVSAFERVRAGGLDRHDAIHALGVVMLEHMRDLLAEGPEATDKTAAYAAALDRLTAAAARRLA